MVVVATSLEVPIKLYMPHLTLDYPNTTCSILGLGDIVIPGIFITYMAQFGYQICRTRAYFVAAIVAYAMSLAICGVCLFVFHSA
mmetsp:Transcript_22483/g.15968  ORF Transcript_22483/g.15968 Transcript_22483/m.15968 type:complete len:85 (-) Transcript_22483:263-517(-)